MRLVLLTLLTLPALLRASALLGYVLWLEPRVLLVSLVRLEVPILILVRLVSAAGQY